MMPVDASQSVSGVQRRACPPVRRRHPVTLASRQRRRCSSPRSDWRPRRARSSSHSVSTWRACRLLGVGFPARSCRRADSPRLRHGGRRCAPARAAGGRSWPSCSPWRGRRHRALVRVRLAVAGVPRAPSGACSACSSPSRRSSSSSRRSSSPCTSRLAAAASHRRASGQFTDGHLQIEALELVRGTARRLVDEDQPQGFTMKTARPRTMPSPSRSSSTPAVPYEVPHMLLAAYLVTGFLVASFRSTPSACCARRRRRCPPARAADPADGGADRDPDPVRGRRHSRPRAISPRTSRSSSPRWMRSETPRGRDRVHLRTLHRGRRQGRGSGSRLRLFLVAGARARR